MEDLEGGSRRAGKSQREESTQLKENMSQNTGLVTRFSIWGTKGGGGGEGSLEQKTSKNTHPLHVTNKVVNGFGQGSFSSSAMLGGRVY